MSLHDTGYKKAPSVQAYNYARTIPLAERCPDCDGLGTTRTRLSATGVDWQNCFACGGTGRKDRAAATGSFAIDHIPHGNC